MQASLVVQIVLGHAAAGFADLLGHHLPQAHGGAAARAVTPTASRTASGRAAISARSIAAVEARGKTSGMESIFEFGFREFARLRAQGGVAADMLLEGSRRAMRVAQLKEIERLEQSLATLATVGSTSPYVGLFGTVWGIMTAFSSLGNVQQATLAMVAPGIAEALIATAMGLFAAIPAVVFYNRYADQVSRLELRYDGFMEELSTILQRYAGRSSRQRRPGDPLSPARGSDVAAFHKGKRRLMGEINVVPYIDVMLVLLIIFMITAPLLTQGIKVDLPKAAAEPIVTQPNEPPLVLSIDAQGRLYLNVGATPSSPSTTRPRWCVPRRRCARSPERAVLVNGDQAVSYGRVVQAMVLLQQAGARKLGFETDAAGEEALNSRHERSAAAISVNCRSCWRC